MSDESTIARWMITVGGAVAGIVGLGVSLGMHKQRLEDHERRIAAVEDDLADAEAAAAASGVSIARLEATMASVMNALQRIESKLDRVSQ